MCTILKGLELRLAEGLPVGMCFIDLYLFANETIAFEIHLIDKMN